MQEEGRKKVREMKKRRCFYLELNRLYKKSVQATSLSPARILFYLIAL